MEKTAKYVLAVLISMVAIGQFVQVVMRSLIGDPAMGVDEILLFPALWLYVLGAVNASRENSHIRANVLEAFLKTSRQRLILAVIREAATLLTGLVLIYLAWDFTAYSLTAWRETSSLYLPTFFADVSLLLGLVFMAAYTTVHLIGHVRCFAGKEQHAGD